MAKLDDRVAALAAMSPAQLRDEWQQVREGPAPTLPPGRIVDGLGTARALVLASPDRSLNRIAADAGRCRTRLSKLVGLSCLAPDIVQAIIEGRQPASLDQHALLAIDLPLDWKQQRVQLGLA